MAALFKISSVPKSKSPKRPKFCARYSLLRELSYLHREIFCLPSWLYILQYIYIYIYSNWKVLRMSWRKVFLNSSISGVLKLLADTLISDLSRQEAKPSPLKLPLRKASLSVSNWVEPVYVPAAEGTAHGRHFLAPAFQKYPELL